MARRIQLSETELVNLIHRAINEDSEPKYCCNPECTTCSKDCIGGVCGDMSAHSGMSVSDRSDFMDEPHIGESDLRRIIKRVINETVSCKCDKCLDENGKCRCCEGLQMWGCAAAQEPRCVTKEYLESKQAEEENPY
tara:strand:- start:17 stop:427 length:411 start_codon:yes stop_codon:yes gene_type:complete